MILLTVLLGTVFFAGLCVIYVMSCRRFEEELKYHSDTLTEQICRNVDISLKELSEKTIPLTSTNERLGPLLTQIRRSQSRQTPSYLGQHIKNCLDEFMGTNYETNWMAVIDDKQQVYQTHRDPRKWVELPDQEEMLALYRENQDNLSNRLGNTVWLSGRDSENIILMRAIFDPDAMSFCGCIIAEVKNTALGEIFDHIDSDKAGKFILYDRNEVPVYSTVDRDDMAEEARHNVLKTEYLISRGKLKIVHWVDLDGKNQRFSDLLFLISGIGLMVYILVIVALWFMFGNMAKNLKILSGNLIRVSCGDFQWMQTHFAKESELDIVSANILQSINGIAQLNGDLQVSRLICMLSKFFRGNIDRKYKFCELREELEYAGNYLELYKNIYPDRLDIQWDVDESLWSVRIPTYILQPIVENSVVHGMEPKVGICTIRISARKEQEQIVVSVWDNGVSQT